jgi:hypothetical protein
MISTTEMFKNQLKKCYGADTSGKGKNENVLTYGFSTYVPHVRSGRLRETKESETRLRKKLGRWADGYVSWLQKYARKCVQNDGNNLTERLKVR